jgi:hypothetical protein
VPHLGCKWMNATKKRRIIARSHTARAYLTVLQPTRKTTSAVAPEATILIVLKLKIIFKNGMVRLSERAVNNFLRKYVFDRFARCDCAHEFIYHCF